MNFYGTNSSSTSSTINYSSLNDFINQMQNETDKINNPLGRDKTVVRLDNCKPGEIRIYKQIVPDQKPLEISRMKINGENRMSLEPGFIGLVIGLSKDPTKKYEIIFVGYPKEEEQRLLELDKIVNRK